MYTDLGVNDGTVPPPVRRVLTSRPGGPDYLDVTDCAYAEPSKQQMEMYDAARHTEPAAAPRRPSQGQGRRIRLPSAASFAAAAESAGNRDSTKMEQVQRDLFELKATTRRLARLERDQ